MTSLSFKWVTCACGNLCAAIPRRELNPLDGLCPGGPGEPRDTILARLGESFYFSIADRCRKEAKETLAQIEARSAELLAEMGIA